MRIAVVNLTGGGFSGGYRKYLSRLMPLLANDRRVSALAVFVPENASVAIDDGVDVRRLNRMAGDIAAMNADVVFVPTARYSAFGSTPVVTMVRNMEPLTVPFGGNRWVEGVKNLARAYDARRACRRAARVIAVSEYVRDFLVSRWEIDRERIATVYHGVDQTESIAGERSVAPRTLFTAGSIRPARGLEDIIGALPLIDNDVQVVIAGGIDPGCEDYADRLRRLCAKLDLTSRVTFTGHLQQRDMTERFCACSAFVLTSRAEACPNTALEAMSAGCAVVSVDRPPMPEFFGDAALYYPVANEVRLADQLRGLLSDGATHRRLSQMARVRAARFTWEATRDRTIEALERVCS